MNIFLYSGGEVNEDLDSQLLKSLGSITPTLGFMGAEHSHAEEDFEEFREHYQSYGVTKFRLFNERHIGDFFESDLIFLGGGNTFAFLKWLRNHAAWKMLRKYIYNDGVIAGESAGAILLSPSIHTASFPAFDRDDNDVGLVDFRSLDFLNFEFFPHYEHRRAYIKSFIRYTKTTHLPLYATTDGSGIVVDNAGIHFYGNVWIFFDGVFTQIS